MQRVLFLCTGNSARSQMAEALLRHSAGDQFEAFSAGLEPKEINPLTRQVMQEVGLDLAGQRSKSVGEYMGRLQFTWLITVCADAEEKCPRTFPGISNRVHWPVDDPAAVAGSLEERLTAFRHARDELDQRIRDWLNQRGQPAGAPR